MGTQVARIRSGETPAVVRMRHRATARDYTDVRDAVRAYKLLIERGTPGEVYNLCSGQAVAIGDLADRLLAIAGVEATIEETHRGPTDDDIATQAGDNHRLAVTTGWSPVVSLERSLTDLLASVCSQAASSGD